MDNELLTEIQRMLAADEAAFKTEHVNRLILSALLNMDRRMRELEKMSPVIRVMLWVGTAIGISIISLIWSFITGQASLIFN